MTLVKGFQMMKGSEISLFRLFYRKKSRLHCRYGLEFNDERPDSIKHLFPVVSIVHTKRCGIFPN